MAKQVTITDKIKAYIASAVGEDIDYSKIVVYEASAASTRPIAQKGSSYDGARISRGFLVEMAEQLPNNSVTLQVMHEDRFLPIGKVFHADVFDVDFGESELNTLFYLDKASEYVSQIDLAIIDEVSIGALPKTAFCSECNFDFRSDYYAMAYGECENGHEIGVDGCHLRLTSLEKWKELSLVNRGASDKPKILTSAKRRLGREELDRLAASGSSADKLYLFASANNTKPTKTKPHVEESQMDPEMLKLASDLGQTKAEKSALDAQLKLATNELATSEAAKLVLQTELDSLKASDGTKDLASTKTKLEAAELSLKDAAEALKPQYQLACTAADITFKDEATMAEMCKTITESGIKLAAIPRQQVTKDGDDVNLASDRKTYAHSAFMTK